MEVNENTSTTGFIKDDMSQEANTPTHDNVEDRKSDHNEQKDQTQDHTLKSKTDKMEDDMSMTDNVDSMEDISTNLSDQSNNLASDNHDSLADTTSHSVQDSTATDEIKDPFMATLHDLCNAIYQKNKSDVAAGSLKQIAKLLQGISKKPLDKKVRQIRSDNIIIKKFVTSVEGALQLLQHVGFIEETIDGKLYQVVPDNCPLVSKYDMVENYLTSFQYNPSATQPSSSSSVKPTLSIAPTTPIVKSTPSMPMVCPTPNCGFYGTIETDFMCSKCFKNRAFSMLGSRAKTAGISQPKKKTARARFRMAILKVRAVCIFKRASKREQQVHKDRCFSCNRKLGITGTECRCGYIFCGKHRYADEHNCTFDHYARHQAALEKANQKVRASKMDNLSAE